MSEYRIDKAATEARVKDHDLPEHERRWAAEKLDACNFMEGLAVNVAASMSKVGDGPFEPVEPQSTDEAGWRWIIRHKFTGILVVLLHNRSKHNPRISVCGSYPRTEDGMTFGPNETGCEHPGITVGANVDPSKIGKDIMRRFWPAYEKAYMVGMERSTQHMIGEQSRHAVILEAAGIVGMHVPSWRTGDATYLSELSGYTAGGSNVWVKISGNGDRLKVEIEAAADIVLSTLRNLKDSALAETSIK